MVYYMKARSVAHAKRGSFFRVALGKKITSVKRVSKRVNGMALYKINTKKIRR